MHYPIELNYNCNNNCIFCFNIYDKTKTYDVAAALKQIDKAKKEGFEYIDFYGGEPFLYQDDLLTLLNYAHQLGLKSSIASNGTYFTPDLVRQLDNLSVFAIRTTLHGHNKLLHELVTKNPGSFIKTVNGIKALVQNFAGEIVINIVITRLNFDHLVSIIKFIESLDPLNRAAIKISNLIYNGQEKIYRQLALPYLKVQQPLNNIFDYLTKKKRKIFIEKYPICLAVNYAVNFVREEAGMQQEICWLDECRNCQFKAKGCVGFTHNYLHYIQSHKSELFELLSFIK